MLFLLLLLVRIRAQSTEACSGRFAGGSRFVTSREGWWSRRPCHRLCLGFLGALADVCCVALDKSTLVLFLRSHELRRARWSVFLRLVSGLLSSHKIAASKSVIFGPFLSIPISLRTLIDDGLSSSFAPIILIAILDVYSCSSILTLLFFLSGGLFQELLVAALFCLCVELLDAHEL